MQEEQIDIPTNERPAKQGVRPMSVHIYRDGKRVHFDAEHRPLNDAGEPIGEGAFGRESAEFDCDTVIDPSTYPEDKAGLAWLQKLWKRALVGKQQG